MRTCCYNSLMDLKRIAFIGRTFGEYRDMFNLVDGDLHDGTVLDCPAGASSFTAEARDLGCEATACDILYKETARQLRQRCLEDLSHIFGDAFDKVSDRYTWEYYGNKERLRAMRQQAFEAFIRDFEAGHSGRYVGAALPGLPFKDGEFRLVLSSHFLFLYDSWLSPETHVSCLRELLRVASREVRVFPLSSMDGSEYARMEMVLSAMRDEGVTVEIAPAGLEFLRGANMMLRLLK